MVLASPWPEHPPGGEKQVEIPWPPQRYRLPPPQYHQLPSPAVHGAARVSQHPLNTPAPSPLPPS